MWEDFKVGMAHLLRWERITVVTDVDWIRTTVRALGFLMPGAVEGLSARGSGCSAQLGLGFGFMSQLRQDRTSGRWVIIAPQRARRPQFTE